MATPLPPEVLPPDYEALGGIGGLLTPREDFIPNLQSVYGDIVQNAADYQYFTAPLSNQGRTTASYGTGNNLVVAPDTPVRLVNNATGEVVYSGVGYEGAQGAIDAANALSASTGKKANWDIQVAGPTMQGFQSVSTDRPDVSGLGIVADVALPVAGSLLAGPLGLGALGLGTAGTAAAGAALGSGLSSAAQGRSIEDALLRAAIAGGGSYLGSQLFAPGAAPTGATVGENLPSWGVLAEPYARAAEAALAGSISGSAPAAVGDIVVTALGRIPTTVGGAFGGLATSLLPSAFDAAQLNDMATMDQMGAEQPSDYVITAQLPTTPVVTPPAILPPGTPPFNPAEDINLTAKTTTKTTPSGAELAALGAIGLGAPAILSTTGGVGTGATTTTGTGGGTGTGAGAGTGTAAVGKGVLGTGLTATQLATLGTLGLGGLSSLLGGTKGAGATTTTPYVSPFGALGGGMSGMDYRIDPNILDYERYGFGPEANFFRPEYSRLVSAGSMMGYAPPAVNTPAGTTTPTYTPLIGGTTTGGATNIRAVSPTPTPPSTPTARPPGFTGTMADQQVGDTQVVDGTTWAYGGDKAGWQMQYKDPTTGNLALLPGNGATNVSSFANNPTVAVNQPYFEQNTANIPGWATTYHGFQQGLMGAGVTGDRKAAAERELFTALETQPFANATALVDYAKNIYNKYTNPSLI